MWKQTSLTVIAFYKSVNVNSIKNLIAWTCMKNPVYFLLLVLFLLLILLLLILFSSTFVLPLYLLPSSLLNMVKWYWVSTTNCRSLRYLTMPLLFVVELNGKQRYVAVIMGTALLSSIPFDCCQSLPWWRILCTFKRHCQCLKIIQNINYSRI